MNSILRGYALISCVVYSVLYQVFGQLTFGSRPVYIGEPVTLTCDYGSGLQLQYVTLDAFNGTHKDGFLWCNIIGANTTSVGLFYGRSFTGCPAVPVAATNVSVTLTATLSLELDYNCTARVNDGNSFFFVVSGPSSPKFFVLPSPPILAPNITTFNESDAATIRCESLNGKPAADISLRVSMPNGTAAESRGMTSSALVLPFPIADWHNATATCNVTNHNFPNMTVTSRVMINHIRSTVVRDVIILTNSSGVTLNCSAYVRSFPGALYSWRYPIGANVTMSSYPISASLRVLQGPLGSFHCTATNIITMENVTIVFIVSSVSSQTSGPLSNEDPQKDEPLWVIGLVLGIITGITIAVVLVALWKRGHFSKGKKERDAIHCITDQRSIKGKSHGSSPSDQCNYVNACAPSIDKNYESLNAQPTSEPTYAQLTRAHRLDDMASYENF